MNFEEVQYRAYKIPIPTTIDMAQDHSITVWADVRGDLRRALLDWQAANLNPDITGGSYFEANRRPTRLGAGGGNEPWIQIDLLAPNYKDITESVLIHGAKVTKVGGIELSNTAGGISTFTVDFKSVWWEQLPGDIVGLKNADGNRHNNIGNAKGDGEFEIATDDTPLIPGGGSGHPAGNSSNIGGGAGGSLNY